jgi:hypothetical protein
LSRDVEQEQPITSKIHLGNTQRALFSSDFDVVCPLLVFINSNCEIGRPVEPAAQSGQFIISTMAIL